MLRVCVHVVPFHKRAKTVLPKYYGPTTGTLYRYSFKYKQINLFLIVPCFGVLILPDFLTYFYVFSIFFFISTEFYNLFFH